MRMTLSQLPRRWLLITAALVVLSPPMIKATTLVSQPLHNQIGAAWYPAAYGVEEFGGTQIGNGIFYYVNFGSRNRLGSIAVWIGRSSSQACSGSIYIRAVATGLASHYSAGVNIATLPVGSTALTAFTFNPSDTVDFATGGIAFFEIGQVGDCAPYLASYQDTDVYNGGQLYYPAHSDLAFYIFDQFGQRTPAVVYDAVTDFSIQNNPAGTWSQGYTRTLGSPFAIHSTAQLNYIPGADRWTTPAIDPSLATARNNTGQTVTGSPGTYSPPPGMLVLHPAFDGTCDVVRWTAPSTGEIIISGKFTGLDVVTTVADTDVHILYNSTVDLIHAPILHGLGSEYAFSVTYSVTAGDAIDFVVGKGPSGLHQNDSTGLQATIALDPTLVFPLKGTTAGLVDASISPTTAIVNTVFDHTMAAKAGRTETYLLYGCDQEVMTFTGQHGDTHPASIPGFAGCVKAYAQPNGKPFSIAGMNYNGGGDTDHLSYDGHPGIDYRSFQNNEVYAATSGVVHYPTGIVGLPVKPSNPQGASAYHVLEVESDDQRLRVYYLHLDTYRTTAPFQHPDPSPAPGCTATVQLPIPEGTHVQAGCLIGLSGGWGPKGAGQFPPHLHFEIHKVVDQSHVSNDYGARAYTTCIDRSTGVPVSGGTLNCVPIDPYGWTLASPTRCPISGQATYGDPYECLTGLRNVRLW